MSQRPSGWAKHRLDPDERYGLRLTLMAIATLLLAIPFSYLVIQVTRDGPLTVVDRDAARAIRDQIAGQDLWVFVLKVITNLGSIPTLYILVGLASIYLWQRGSRRTAIYVVVTSQIGGLLSLAVKAIVGRARPEQVEDIAQVGKSFPSGHALNSTVVYGVLLLAFMALIPARWRRRAVIGYVVLILAIGATRLGLVVHYLSDVLAGYVLGFAWLALSTAIFSIWREERGRRPVEVFEDVTPEPDESESPSAASGP